MKFVSPQQPSDQSFNVLSYGAKGDGSVDDSPAIQRAIDAAAASAMGSIPTFVAAGTVSSGTTTAAPGIPAGYAADDIFLMFVESNWNEPVATPTDWAVVDGFPKSNGSAVTGASTLSCFWKRATASESAPTVADPGDHIVAQIFGFRGCRKYGVPWDGVATAANDTPGTSASCPTITTNSVNNLVVNAVTTGTDAASTAAFSGWTNASLGSVTEIGDIDASAGAGGGFGVATGTKAALGAVSATTATLASSAQVTATIALAPIEGGTGTTVVIPPGNYKLNTQLNVRSNMNIVADGAYLWCGSGNNYLLVCNYSNVWGFNGGHNIDVRGGIWDGKGHLAATDAAYNVMGFYHCSNITVHDLVIRNVASWHGFEYNATQQSLLDRVRFEGFRDTTAAQSRQFSAAMQIDLGSNDSTCSKNITVQNCYAGPAIDGSGLGSFGRGFDSHTDALGKWYTGIRVVNNVVEGTLDNGIQTYSWNDSVVSGNIIRNAGASGIKIAGQSANDVQNITIANNIISTCGAAGIEIADVSSRVVYNTSISSNIIDNASYPSNNQPSILIRFTKGCTISNNTVRGGQNIACSIFDSTGIAVTSNSLYNVGHDGFRLNANCIESTISNNIVNGTPQRGIYITGSGCTNNSVVGNLFVNCGSSLTSNGVMENSSTTGAANAFIGNRVIKGTGASTYGFKTQVATTVLVGNSFKGWSNTYTSAINGTCDDSIDAAATANNTIA